MNQPPAQFLSHKCGVPGGQPQGWDDMNFLECIRREVSGKPVNTGKRGPDVHRHLATLHLQVYNPHSDLRFPLFIYF